MAESTADQIQRITRAVVERHLGPNWTVRIQRSWDVAELGHAQYPLAIVKADPARELEAESDNRVLTAYPIGVVLIQNKVSIDQTSPDLVPFIRGLVQCLERSEAIPGEYTIPQLLAEESVTLEWLVVGDYAGETPTPDENMNMAAIVVTVGILEDRSVSTT